MTEVTFDYQPRKQFAPFHMRGTRWAIMVCHRRAGKTVACINDLIAKAVYTKKKNARFAYVAPFFRQAKDVAWEYLKQYAAPVIRGKPKESILRIELFNGAWITLYGADNPDSFRGMYFDGLVIDEYGDMRPKLWTENLLPTLADRRGWAAFIGTPKGPNHFKDSWDLAQQSPETWFSYMLKASESGILPEEELALMKAQMSEDEYEQELECSFTAAVTGTYYAKLLNQYSHHVVSLSHDRSQPVQVVMDIGRTDAAAAWFWQETSDGISMPRYHEVNGSDPQYWDSYFKSTGYNIETLWLPHDAKAKTFATRRSTIEQFADAGYNVRIVPKLEKMDGINAARLMLPIVWFDKEGCSDGLDALRNHRRRWDDAKKIFSDDSIHDWSSHGADAFRYFALVARQTHGSVAKKFAVNDIARVPNPHIIHEQLRFKPKPFTLNDLWEDYDQERSQRDILRIR